VPRNAEGVALIGDPRNDGERFGLTDLLLAADAGDG
jgi:hypothetical protein